MPHPKKYRGRKKYSKRSNKSYKKKNYKRTTLSKPARREVKKIAQQALINLGEPKRRSYVMGQWHTGNTLYSFGCPKLIVGDALGGVKMDAKTVSIPVGRIPYGGVNHSNAERAGMLTLLKGIVFNFIISWNPSKIDPGMVCRFRLVSTMNDPTGGNISYVPGQSQDALYHIPSHLLPPANTLGLRYKGDLVSRLLVGMDPKEYNVLWSRSFVLRTSQEIEFKMLKFSVKHFFSPPVKQEYIGQAEQNILGRRYFLLYNSTAVESTSSLVTQNCPSLHAILWTYFRDRD